MPLDEQKLVAAITPTTGYKSYPPYINVKRSGDYGRMVTIAVRGNESGDQQGTYTQATFTREDFALFLIQAAREL